MENYKPLPAKIDQTFRKLYSILDKNNVKIEYDWLGEQYCHKDFQSDDYYFTCYAPDNTTCTVFIHSDGSIYFELAGDLLITDCVSPITFRTCEDVKKYIKFLKIFTPFM